MSVQDHLQHYRQRGFYHTDFEDPNVPRQYPPDLELEPVHLNIALRLDLADKTASGTVTTTVRARRAGPSKIELDAVDFQDLELSDAGGHDLSWRYDGKKIHAVWQRPFDENEERQLLISYKVVEPVDGLTFSRPDDAYPDQPWFAATDHETERARHWLPCIDLPNVRTALDFQLTAEERFTILANGYLVDEKSHGDGNKTAHWRLEQLCPSYLVCFAIGDFVRADDGHFDDGDKKIELAYFSTRDHSPEHLMLTFGRTGAMMEWMTRKLDAPFPYPKYYQFAVPATGGAMENISLVSWDDSIVADQKMAQEAAWWIDMINVHEMAHSYFGDAVVCRDFAHAWLKESWATYMEQCWLEDTEPEDETLYLYYTDAHRYFKEADERYKRPIVTRRFKSSWDMYDGHLYPGGACRLRTLRKELGDDTFWRAVRDYLKRFNGKVVETEDFKRIMEEYSGRSLGQFFDQWFYSPGYPDIKVSFQYDKKKQQGTFEIEQKQVDKEKEIPLFSLSTDVGWVVSGELKSVPVELTEEKHKLVVAMPDEPEQVRFDPHHKVLHKLSMNPGDPLLLRQLTDAKDVIGRCLAAHELAKTGKKSNIEAIVNAYENEPFWGVREQMVRALAHADMDAAVGALARIYGMEQEPKLLESIYNEGASYRDQRVRDALVNRLQGDLPPLAARAAYVTLGAQRKLAPWDLLVEASRREGYNGFAQSGAFLGLAASRRDEARQLLIDATTYGSFSNRVRPSVVRGLADLGQGLEKAQREEVVELLIDLLRDPWQRVRMMAVQGLVNIKAPEAIPVLQSFARTLSHQREIAVERLVSSLRAEDKVDGSALKKQVEELQEKMRKLEDALLSLQARVEPAEEDSNS